MPPAIGTQHLVRDGELAQTIANLDTEPFTQVHGVFPRFCLGLHPVDVWRNEVEQLTEELCILRPILNEVGEIDVEAVQPHVYGTRRKRVLVQRIPEV